MNWYLALIKMLALILPTLRVAVQATTTLLDDIGLRLAELFVTDETLQEMIKAWVEGLTEGQKPQLVSTFCSSEAAADTAGLRGVVVADAELMKAIDYAADRMNINWEKLLEWVIKYLPMILPIFLNKK